MVLQYLCIFALLFAPTFASVDCSREDSCFGEPAGCDPDDTCESLFQFEEDGSLNLYLRDFEIPYGYAAFEVGKHEDETVEYFICVPQDQQRLRAIAELGGVVLVTEQNMTGVVERIGMFDFRCLFDVIELPPTFRQNQVFFVTKGTFDEALIIFDGKELHNLELDDESNYEDDIDEEFIPNMHYLGPAALRSGPEDVVTEDDNATLTESLARMNKLNGGLSRKARSKGSVSRFDDEDDEPRRRNRKMNDDEDDEGVMPRRRNNKRRSSNDDEEEKPRRRDHKSRRHDEDEDEDDVEEDDEEKPRRRSRKPKSRASRYEDEDEDEDDEEERPRRRDSKSKRRQNRRDEEDDEEDEEDEDDEHPRRKSKRPSNRRNRSRKDDEDDEKDEDMDDDEEVSSNKNRKRRDQRKKRGGKSSKDSEEEDEYTDLPYEIDEDYDNHANHSESLLFALIILLTL